MKIYKTSFLILIVILSTNRTEEIKDFYIFIDILHQYENITENIKINLILNKLINGKISVIYFIGLKNENNKYKYRY